MVTEGEELVPLEGPYEGDPDVVIDGDELGTSNGSVEGALLGLWLNVNEGVSLP